ncbi:hypothetical protein [Nostoc sp. UHCC 0302]|uniref:hypothetical protein n=1 Tax=Nostoc sp. UHCC 0302 TaxID=3134896 RepID=UPI00311CD397
MNDCNTSLGEDAMNRVSTNGLFVTFFFQIGINYPCPMPHDQYNVPCSISSVHL